MEHLYRRCRVPNEQLNALFTDGKVALYVGGPWNLNRFSRAGVKYGVAAVPYFAGGKKRKG